MAQVEESTMDWDVNDFKEWSVPTSASLDCVFDCHFRFSATFEAELAGVAQAAAHIEL